MKRQFFRVLFSGFLLCSTTGLMAQTQTRTPDFFTGSTHVKSFIHGGQVILLSSENDKQVKIVNSTPGMKKNWEQTIDGSLMFGASLEDKILIVVSTDFAAMVGGNNSTYKAAVLNPKDGRIIAEKVIYNGNNDYVTISDFAVSKGKKTFSLFARETSVKRNVKVAPGAIGAILVAKKMDNNANIIRSFSVSTFNSNLEITDKVFPVLPKGDFVGAATTNNNDLYVAVAEDKKGVTIAKYEAGKDKATATVVEPFNHSAGFLGTAKLNDYLSLITDTLHNNRVYLSGAFKNDDEFICIFNKYDFGTNQHNRFKKSFRKADLKAFEKSYTPINKQFADLELGSATGVEVLGVMFSEDKYLVALGDVHYVPSSPGSRLPATYNANGMLIYNLDDNLVEKSVSAIPRSYENVPRPSFTSYYKDNAWYLFASDDWRAKFSVAKINATTGKVEDLKLIEPDKAGKGDVAELSEMVITDKYLILPVKDIKMSFSAKFKYDVHMYQINW
ncbi:hypothetical protein [Desertivirga brevis]|uniref:hypothetical protein n=1 Tax=Desertivirga brevis TaxID=2810310 RepID=UPI001A975845|nr:hypothetical protein [Pedobacter sp. SYSU D00873]